MAPLPQPSPTPSSSTSDPQPSSVLPGLKRGIAVGVASCVCLIMIALLALFVIRRRKQCKAQQQLGHSPNARELPGWLNEKNFPPLPEKKWIPVPSSPIEVDTHTIHELEAGQVPELPTKVHVPGLQELDAGSTIDKSEDLKRESLFIKDDVERHEASEPRYREVPTLRIPPPEMSPLGGSSLPGMSPLLISPLEEVYKQQSPRSPRSPQHSL